jgi:hypothetical protein
LIGTPRLRKYLRSDNDRTENSIMSNYSRHLQYELQRLEMRAKTELDDAAKKEKKMEKSTAMINAQTRKLIELKREDVLVREEFRSAHAVYCGTRQEIGEVQSELGLE